jgi:hypothetical protein
LVRHAALGLTWTALGLRCWDKAVLVPIVVVGVTALRRPAAVRRYWPLWLGYLAVTGGYVAVYLTLTGRSGPVPVGDVPALAGTMIGGTFLPGLLGGPWTAPAAHRRDGPSTRPSRSRSRGY